MTSQTPKSLAETLAERADDAAELRKKEKSQPRAAKLAVQIAAYLDNKLSADEMNALYQRHGEAIEQERLRRNDASDHKQLQDAEDATIFWAGGGTRDEGYAAYVETEKFLESHPALRANTRENASNGALLRQWLKVEKLPCTAANLEKGYADLRSKGAIVSKTEEERRIENLSADEYLRENVQLHDTRTPPVVLQSVERALNTLIQNHPEYIASHRNYVALEKWLHEVDLPISYGNLEAAFEGCRNAGLLELSDAVTQHGSTRVTDFGPRELGIPPRPKKYSFRKMMEGMSATEYADRINNDPAFRASVEALDK